MKLGKQGLPFSVSQVQALERKLKRNKEKIRMVNLFVNLNRLIVEAVKK
jgi:hypothetical protein